MNNKVLLSAIKKEKSILGISFLIDDYVASNFLKENVLSLYEAFQLMEISYRLNDDSNICHSFMPSDIIAYLNMAMLALLFDEKGMYSSFCETTYSHYVTMLREMKRKKYDGWDSKKYPHYIFSDEVTDFLKCDREHLEILSNMRHKTRKNDRSQEPYHWQEFPYSFGFEDELLKIIKGEVDHFEINKTISPEVQEIMIAAELKAIELE